MRRPVQSRLTFTTVLLLMIACSSSPGVKGGRRTPLKQRRLVGRRLVDVAGGMASREEKDEPRCSVWSHVSFTLLSVVVFGTS